MPLGRRPGYAARFEVARVLKIFFHDACFDGTSSAALFSAFYRDAIDRSASARPVGMVHRDGDPFDGVALDADDHACVDFRFCADPKMRWWFDHHPTAFQPPALRAVFEREHLPTWFFDPTAPSCAGLIARVLEASWGWKPPAHLVEAVGWADTIDAARFPSAESAVALVLPAQRLAAWLAHGRTPVDTAQYVEWLTHSSLAEVAERPEIASQLAVVEVERARELEAVGRLGVWHGDVIVFDRFAELGARSPGFLGYLLYPTCLYSVSGTRVAQNIKISVGVNPWSAKPRRHDIGEMCARYGGGGHAAVGGVTLGPDELTRAQATMAAIIAELAGG
jgi:hypothetical protein